jgi:excisionase family DNA binding protein
MASNSPTPSASARDALGPRQLGMTTSQVARHLGVSLSTVRRWSDMGHLRSYRTPGGQRRFSRQQVEEFLASLESGQG